MGRQSEALAAETAAMRSFDLALQKAADLPVPAQGRVLRYVADHISEQLAAHRQAVLEEATGRYWPGEPVSIAGGLGGAGSPAGWPGRGAVAYGGGGAVTAVPHDGD